MRVSLQGRFSWLLGSCGLVLATNGGCLEAPHLELRNTGGHPGAGYAGLAGAGAQGGTNAGAGSGGTDEVGAGTGGQHPHQGGTGGGTAAGGTGAGGSTAGEAGADAGAGNGAGGTGGGSNNGGDSGENAGGVSGDAGADNQAGAPPSVGGAGGLAATGGISGSGGSGGVNQAGTSAGGFAGNGDVEEPFTGPCPTSVMNGWVTVADLGFDPAANTTTPTEVVVTDATALENYATSPDPYVIRISGTIALPVLDVTSNKTIMGDDSNATLEGGIRLQGTSTDPADMISNVVIKNLHIDATTANTSATANEQDGILISYGHHVWIDHVDVWDAPGDNLAVSNGSDYITVSWSKFRFVNGARRTGARIGHSDTNATEDSGRLKVSFHHNWWTDSLDQRMPRVRFGQVHVFNNYYSNRNTSYPDNTYCIAAAYESELLVENNFFDESYNPHVFFSFVNGVSSYSEPTAQMVANGNTYVGVSDLDGGKQSGQGPAFVPPYTVTLEPADDVLRNTIRHCAGVN
jgi:pectate lyase